MFESFYGKPKKAIHYGSVNCDGNEQMLINCLYVPYSLELGKELNIHVEVAGVNCQGNLTHNISITESLTTSISTHLTTTGKFQYVSSTTTSTPISIGGTGMTNSTRGTDTSTNTAINTISTARTGSTHSTRATGVSDTSTTSTSNEVVILSIGVTALVFGIAALIVGYVSAF